MTDAQPASTEPAPTEPAATDGAMSTEGTVLSEGTATDAEGEFDAMTARVAGIEARPLEERAAAYGGVAEELRAALEGADPEGS
ncbi:hypothetical protein [Agromyces archimandritae]|uniref:Uncharacterized protein n=1 Tax=Agromyces archimandritae TaxID=2781962 RepID=A0A975FM35_9MICO|nr:hypothetical protein [Agromyces archimandritae]QTX04983.1 hypothetical protein G127AT_01670 [Agromyces archimandritae]